jgi:hypothetical protein
MQLLNEIKVDYIATIKGVTICEGFFVIEIFSSFLNYVMTLLPLI